MKRNFIVTLTLVALSLLAVSTSFAQDRVKANVPFAFQVGKASLPAGTYVVSSAADHAIRIYSRDASAAALSTFSTEEKLKRQHAKLVFHKYGNSYFLAEIWDGSGNSGMKLPENKKEAELRASSQASAPEELIVVAMK
jgi:hypothetical protein